MSRETEVLNRRLLRARDAMDRAYAEPLGLLNVPRLLKPTSRQISMISREVSSSMNIERSTRRRWR